MRIFFLAIALFISIGFESGALAQVTGEYRSVDSNTWNNIATWERFDGASWVPAVATPTSADNIITIRSGHVVTISANITVDQVVVVAGGQITLNAGITLTLNNGPGTDLTISGVFNNSGSTAGTGTIAFSATSTYQHNYTTSAGTIPTASWDSTSTCEIIGYTTNTIGPGGLSQPFGNVVWNSPGQSGIISTGGNLNNIRGKLSIISTGTGTLRLATTSSPTISITDSLIISGGIVSLASSGSPTINLTGSFEMTNGTLLMSEGTGLATINVSGNYSHTGGTINETSSGSGSFRFTKNGTQTFTGGGTVTNTINYVIVSGSTLDLGTNIITGNGNFTLSSGGAIGIGSPDGITSSGATGNVQLTGSRSYSTGGGYVYNGLVPQVAGNGLPATIGSLTIDNPNGFSLPQTLTMSGNLTLTQGTLNMNGFDLSVGGNWTNNGGALDGGVRTVTFTGAAKTIGGTQTTTFPSLSIAPGATITMNNSNSSTGLGFPVGATNSTLTHAGSSILTVNGNVLVNQPSTAGITATWAINAGSATVSGNVTLGGASGTSTRASRVTVTSGSLSVAGVLTLETGTSSAVATLSIGSGSVTLNSALNHDEGTVTFTDAGSLILNGAYSFASGGSATPILTFFAGSTLQFAGNVTVSATGGLTALATSNMVFTGTSVVTPTTSVTTGNVQLNSGSGVTLAGNLSVAGNWTNNGGTLTGGGNTVTFTGASKSIGGSSMTTFPVIAIGSGATVSLDNGNSCTGLTFNASATASSLTHNTSSALTVNGAATVNQPTASFTTNWNVNAGSATVTGNLNLGGNNTTTSRIARIVVTTGSLSIGGNLVFNSSSTTAQTAVVDLSTGGGTGALNLAGALTLANTTGTLTPGTGGSVVNYNGSTAQTIVFGSAITYHNLHVNNSSGSGALLGAAISATNVTGNLRVQSGILENGGFAVVGNASRTFEVANGATFKMTGTSGVPTGFGTRTFGPSSTTDFGGTGAQTVAALNYGNIILSGTRTTNNVTLASSGTIGIAGSLTASASFSTGGYVVTGSTVDYNGTGAQTVTPFVYNNLVVSGSRGAASVTIGSSGTVAVSGTFTPSATFGGGTFITAGSTLSFSGAGQSIPLFPYHHISTSGSGTKSPANGLTVNGNLTIGTGTTFDAAALTHALRGNITNNGTFTAATSTILLNGASAQTLTGALTFAGLTVDNGAGISLSGTNITVNGVFSLTTGPISTGANRIIIASTGSVIRTGGRVAGNLQKRIPLGSGSTLFEVGDVTTYAPVTLAFSDVTVTGDVTAKTTAGDHPNIVSSGLKANRSVNRYYTLSNAGVVFGSYDPTFQFVPGDVDTGASTSNFAVKRFSTPDWFTTTTGTRTATTTQATGLTSFGDFAVAEGGAAFPGTSTVSASPTSLVANGTSTSSITVQLKDDQGNNITTGGEAVGIQTNLGTIGGVTDNGNGTYSATLTSSTVADTATVTATVSGILIVNNAKVAFLPGPPSLSTTTITGNPSSIVANGTSTSTITVQLKDINGNNLKASGGTVGLSTTRGTLGPVTDHANGTYTATLTSSAVLDTAVISGTLDGSPLASTGKVAFIQGAPFVLVWTHEPRDTVAGAPIPSQSFPTVEIRDAQGFLVTSATNSITISIGSNPGSGTLSGTVTRNAVGGIAEFNNLSINKSGVGYTLIATSGSLIKDTSVAFTIRAGPATQVVFIQQPTGAATDQIISPAVLVRLRDAFGNDVKTQGVSITLTLSSGTGTLSGTLAKLSDTTGTATFDNLSINLVGSKRLTAASSGLTSALSNFFTISPAPSTIVSDDFNAFSLNPVWTFINPFNDATFSMTGINTPNAAATIAVPGGFNHDPWSTGNKAPRILQSTNNTDFEVEVKFLTGMTERFQLEGILVEQDSVNFLRFDFDSDGSVTKTFVAKIIGGVATQLVNLTVGANGVAPLYMRVRRVGNDWTQFYSLDGTAWTPTGTFTQTLTVTKVGPFIGNTNTGVVPAHTGSIDYFFNTASPIVPEDGGTAVDTIPPVISNVQVTTGDTNATITWSTNEPSTSQVSYGLTPAYGSGTVIDSTLKTNHSMTLNGLLIQRVYHFRVGSRDGQNNLALRPDSTFATKDSSTIFSDDFNTYRLNNRWSYINPLSDATFTLVGQNTTNAWARIVVPGGAAHEPWTTGNNAPRLMQAANNRDFEIEVKFESGMTQQYQIQGVVIEQDLNNFLRFDFNSNGAETKIFAASLVSGTPVIFVNSVVGANGVAPQYMRLRRQGNQWTQQYSFNGSFWTTAGTFSHTMNVTAAGPFIGNTGTTPPGHTGNIDYFFKTSSPINPEDGGIAIDDVPPIINNIQKSTTGTTATLTWTTNELARSSVSFGPTSAYENGTVTDTTLKMSHAITLKNLTPASLYHFRVSSADSVNNVTNSADSMFTTGAASTVISDDFNRFSLNTAIWTYTNPRSDATLSMINQNTDSAAVRIVVPGGLSHEPWTGGNFAPRIMQPANNVDVELEAKFDSRVNTQVQMQGIIVQQSANDYLRCDIYSNGSSTFIFAATILAGTPTTRINSSIGANGIVPQYLRVRREGNLWIVSYSFNRTSWTVAGSFSHTMTVSSVGPFVGNSGATVPAHTGRIDYFFNNQAPVVPEDGGTAIDDIPPVITNVQVSTTGTSATFTWTTDEPAQSSVSFGPTAAYENGTVTNTPLVTSHQVVLNNLTPALTYHFRISSSDASNNVTNRPDSTFLTGPASTIVSDDFNSTVLNTGLWTYSNPRSDATLSMVNTNTDSAWATINVPGGISHEPWTGGNFAPRLMQTANNTDFEVEVKFDSRVNQRFQLQGIIVQQSATEYIRFDFHSDGTNTKIFAASFVSGTPTTRVNITAGANGILPTYMRIRRVGNQWTQSYSTNGTSWTTAGTFSHTLAVSSIGPFIGNTGSPTIPAHLGKIDYFFNTASPIVPEDASDTTPPILSNIQVNAGATQATITWTTNEPATSSVSYGPTTAYENGAITSTPRVTSHSIMLTGLAQGSLYNFRVTSKDSSNNSASSTNLTFTTQDSLPPVISNIQVNAGATQATVTWTTNEPATSSVSYGPTTAYENGAITSTTRVTSHSIMLTGLAQGSLYNFRVTSKDSSNNSASSTNLTFTTQDSLPPVISNIQVNAGATQATVTWTTNEPSTSSVAFGPTISYENGTMTDTAKVTHHSVMLTGLTQAALYHFRVSSQDASGNLTTSADSTFSTLDSLPPVITDVQVLATATQASISWSTNEPASSLVSYGSTTGYENGSISDTTKVTSHTLILTELTQGALYHFRVSSTDPSNNTASSADSTFTTLDSLPPVITNIQVVKNATSATVSWTTNEPANSAVSFGQTGSYELGTIPNGTMVTSHAIVLPGLREGTLYHFRVSSTDASSNTASSTDSTFTTPAAPPVISNLLIVVTATSATVTWTTNEVATSAISYGLTSSYGSGTVSDTVRKTNHTLQLSGLVAGTTYHFSISSSDSLGATASTPDSTFMTRPISNLQSDNFNDGVLNSSIWAFIDPLGGGSVNMTGTQAVLSVPGGTAHDVWSGGNKAPRIVQLTTDSDFEIEVKFDSAFPGSFEAMQGIIIQQDSNNFIRFDFTTDGTNTRLHAATISGGTPSVEYNSIIGTTGIAPLYMRVKRIGHVWTQSYSLNGITFSPAAGFTKSITTNEIGLFVGNRGSSPPAFSSKADFFFNNEKGVATPLKAFLQGPFNSSGDTMRTDLKNGSLLPLSQPYNASPWNYSTGSETVASIPSGVVDWVLLELRTGTAVETKVAMRAGFLTNNGLITDLNGIDAVRFPGLPDGSYYVVVRHRNHLGIMTSSSLALSSSTPLYDFTTAQAKAFGVTPMREVKAGVFGMRSGDGNADGGIDALDRNTIWRAQNGTAWNYSKLGDFNLDGGIDALDLNLHWRTNNGTASQIP